MCEGSNMDADVRTTSKLHINISPRSLLTDDQQNELMWIRDKLVLSYFRAGDIANESILNNATREGATAQMVYDEVGVWLGKSGRTVRYYAETAAFFSPRVRSDFDMLPFSHFDLARNYKDDWWIVLDIARSSPAMTVDRLELLADKYFEVRGEACEKDSEENPKCAPHEVLTNAYGDSLLGLSQDELSDLEARIREEKKPTQLAGSSAPLIGRLMNALAELRRLVGEYDLSEEVKRELAEHGGALMLLIPRIISEIDGRREHR